MRWALFLATGRLGCMAGPGATAKDPRCRSVDGRGDGAAALSGRSPRALCSLSSSQPPASATGTARTADSVHAGLMGLRHRPAWAPAVVAFLGQRRRTQGLGHRAGAGPVSAFGGRNCALAGGSEVDQDNVVGVAAARDKSIGDQVFAGTASTAPAPCGTRSTRLARGSVVARQLPWLNRPARLQGAHPAVHRESSNNATDRHGRRDPAVARGALPRGDSCSCAAASHALPAIVVPPCGRAGHHAATMAAIANAGRHGCRQVR